MVRSHQLCYLLVRFNEHKAAFRTNSQNSNYTKHLIKHTHSFGPSQDTMQILKRQKKGAHFNTIERYHIYTEFTKNNHLNHKTHYIPQQDLWSSASTWPTVTPPIEAVTPPNHKPGADLTTHMERQAKLVVLPHTINTAWTRRPCRYTTY